MFNFAGIGTPSDHRTAISLPGKVAGKIVRNLRQTDRLDVSDDATAAETKPPPKCPGAVVVIAIEPHRMTPAQPALTIGRPARTISLALAGRFIAAAARVRDRLRITGLVGMAEPPQFHSF
jgi:hypothetical protein